MTAAATSGVLVVAYTPRPDGRAALHRAVEEARLRGLRLVVINASRGDALVDPGFAPPEDVAEVRTWLESTGLTYELRQLPSGAEPADQVVDAAAELDAELIVIGMRRRSPVGKLLLGSTAQRVLLDAACAVLAVKP
ncbi:universal stress protein [Pseudonocardia aurantiaca]|uniref:Universal stress protein n=1 Tax=Pseudonocardia aurantiaca TaxID=75290 RepID=A0ABW4FLT7_9PSEU